MSGQNEERWINFIKPLLTEFNCLETNKSRAVRILSDKISNAVKKDSSDDCGVLFSGGIDSTLISFLLKKQGKGFTCYSIGIERSQDIEWAERIAKALNFKLRIKVLTSAEFERVIQDVTKILKCNDVMKVTVGAVLYSGIHLAKLDKINILFSGLGSEELFAGYQRHEEALKNGLEAVHNECISGLFGMFERDIKRDMAIASAGKATLKVPFLNEEVIRYGMSIHPMYKIDNETKKIIIREVAESLGLPKEFAWRKKKAAQYGSNFINGLDKLAKARGFNRKKDYLQSLLL